MSYRAHRLVAAGALAVAAVAAPLAIASISESPKTVVGAPCLAWFGNQEDNICLGRSNGNGVNVGTVPSGSYGYGPYNGGGFIAGPLLPGQTWTRPIG